MKMRTETKISLELRRFTDLSRNIIEFMTQDAQCGDKNIALASYQTSKRYISNFEERYMSEGKMEGERLVNYARMISFLRDYSLEKYEEALRRFGR